MTQTITIPRAPGVMRGINELIHQSLENGGRTEPVAFFCECGDNDCYRTVWLTPAEFAVGRLDPGWRAFAEGHA